MDLIDRYIYAVCKHLPAKNKKEAEVELRASIMNALKARTAENPASEDVLAVLKEFDPPRKAAHHYTNRGGYLIGPQLYDLYMLILKIVLGVAFLGVVISFVIQTAQDEESINVIGFLGKLYSILVGAVGMVTLVFAIAERLNPGWHSHLHGMNKEWNPAELPAIPKSYEMVKPSEIIIGMLFTLLFFILVNYYVHLLGIYILADGTKPSLFLSLIDIQKLSPFLPYINMLLGLALLKQVLLLKDGRYKVFTFGMEILINLGALTVIAIVLTGPDLIAFDQLDLVIQNPENLMKLKGILSMIYRSVLWISGIIGFVDICKYGLRYFRYLARPKASLF